MACPCWKIPPKKQLRVHSMNFYKRLNWWQKILFWFVMMVLFLITSILSHAVPKISSRAIEQFKAQYELAYDTAGDFSILSSAVQFRRDLNSWGFDREGIVQSAFAGLLKGYYEDIHAKVPNSDCEYYFADFLYYYIPFVVTPKKEDLNFLTSHLTLNAPKIHDLPCKSLPMEKFFKIYAYNAYLYLSVVHISQLPLSEADKISLMDMLVKNTIDLVNRTKPQDYMDHPKVLIKKPNNYTLLLAQLYNAILLNAEISNKTICDTETRQLLKFVEKERSSSMQFFKERNAISEDELQQDENIIGEIIRNTNLKLSECK